MAYQTYQPSGKFGLATFIYPLITGIIGATTGAWIYQFFCDLLPFLWLNVLFALIFGLWLGIFAMMGLHMGQSRSAQISMLMAILTGMAGVAVSHELARNTFLDEYQWNTEMALWDEYSDQENEEGDYMARARSEANKIVDDLALAGWEGYLEKRAEIGYSFTRRFRERSLEGTMVYVLWAIEALLIISICAWVTKEADGDPFCEASGGWCERVKFGSIKGVDMPALHLASMSKDLASMLQPKRDDNSAARVDYKLYKSPKGIGPTYISGTAVEIDGEGSETSTDLFKFALIDEESLQALADVLEPTLTADEVPAEEAATGVQWASPLSQVAAKIDRDSKGKVPPPPTHPGAKG